MATNSPGPTRPFFNISFSSMLIIPTSEPDISKPSFVKIYLRGLNPFLSIPEIIQSPKFPQTAAGPSHGSITALQ